MSRFGYARESARSAALAEQVETLTLAGAERVWTDITEAGSEGEGLAQLLGQLRPGDAVTVTTVDRLGTSLSGVVSAIDQIRRAGGTATTLTGEPTWPSLLALAECSRVLAVERQALARQVAKLSGRQTGRPKSTDAERAVSAERALAARRMKQRGDSTATICAELGVSRATLYRDLASVSE
jgi:DNA invertase Pin-like site-specific DNA recombinase